MLDLYPPYTKLPQNIAAHEGHLFTLRQRYDVPVYLLQCITYDNLRFGWSLSLSILKAGSRDGLVFWRLVSSGDGRQVLCPFTTVEAALEIGTNHALSIVGWNGFDPEDPMHFRIQRPALPTKH